MAFWGKLKKEKTVSQEPSENKFSFTEDEIITAWPLRPSAAFSTTTSSSTTTPWGVHIKPPPGYTAAYAGSYVSPDYSLPTALTTWDLGVVDGKLVIDTSDNKYQISRDTLLEAVAQVKHVKCALGMYPNEVFSLASLLLIYLDAVTKIQADD